MGVFDHLFGRLIFFCMRNPSRFGALVAVPGSQPVQHSKSQTTKNLDKPWEQLTPLMPGNENFSAEEMQHAREMLDIQVNQQEEEEEESMSAEETDGISTLPNSETSSTIATANATPSSDEPFTSVPTSLDPNSNLPPSSDPPTPKLHGQPNPNSVPHPASDGT
ncbi:hypothetical protein K435DRAFT_842405 [Dendrothele bispora CBS 962.96]|uniref:Uncharacterized protein n=1 Tax=Dendrothele bispora (strain CBS 962.96) TaxID=1314807 RepID=A0A4S8LFH5_DENBC|nr:hypothetical protein K435DRAFT_842405 [Dendrothele bispora CBS 962.96]